MRRGRTANVRHQHNIFEIEKSGIEFGFVFKHVETSMRDLSVIERLHQVFFIYHSTPGRINENYAVFHHRYFFCAHHLTTWHVEGNEIRSFYHIVQ